MKAILIGAALVASLTAMAGAASAATIPLGTTTVSAASATGSTQAFGPISDTDVLTFTVTGTPYLQPGPSYGTNAAGVVTVYGQQSNTPVGSALVNSNENMGFDYGALIATLNGVSRQVFAATSATGLGSSNPPTTLTFSGTVASLFGSNVAGAVNSLNFRVDDFNYGDNTGGFTITGVSTVSPAVPEPATWAMMIVGFGAMGYSMRRRAKTTPRIRFA